jgi:PAS domain S-box-containing protein
MSFTQKQLARALDTEQFVPHFQPLVDLRSGEIHGFEILARWNHPTLGFISPVVFIPLLEQYRLMNNLTAALLIPAFHVAHSLPSSVGLSVNLSPPQLHDRSLPNLIELIAHEAGFDLHRLTVELTETALVDDLELAGTVARDLKDRGIRLSLDDFGTGYSSLLHLQSLPFDELKIDASFVRSITDTRQSRKITAAVISLGLSLGLKTVAEGIEDQNQANLLAWQGCDFGQGFLYGAAVAADQLSGFFDQPKPLGGVTTEVPAATGGSLLSLDARPSERFSQLRAIYDSAPVGLAFVDTQLRYVNLNQRLAQGNGRSVQAHLGRKVSEVLPPSLYAQVEPYLLRALQGESFAAAEINKHIPGESPATLLVSYQPVRDEVGEILGVCVSMADITAGKQKENELRCSEARLNAIFQASPVGIGLVESSTYRVLSANPRIQELIGFRFTPSMIWSSKRLRIYDSRGNLIPAEKAPLARAMDSGEITEEQELLIHRTDGTRIWLRLTAAPVRLEDGTQWGAVVIAQDIDSTRREHQKLLEITQILESATSHEPPRPAPTWLD